MGCKIKNTFDLLKVIIEKDEDELSTQILIEKYLKGLNGLEAYSFIEDLKNEGYITILPITGQVGPQNNTRTFYEMIKDYDFIDDINQVNVVNVTIKGYDYYSKLKTEKWRFWIPLTVSIIALASSILGLLFQIIN